jgi:Amt family ammonium transporter
MGEFFTHELSVQISGILADAANSMEAADLNRLAAEGSDGLFTANNVWMMMATALVFIMHLGFAGVEAGFGQSKNTVNILFKNTITPIIGLITYFVLGLNLM